MQMQRRADISTARGAALILALLVMLVLSGLALVAMNSVATSSALSGMHRLQAQAFSVSEALNQLGMSRSGRQASTYYAQMQDDAMGMDDETLPSDDGELGALRRGGYVLFSSEGTDEGVGQVDLQTDTGGNLLDDDGGDFVAAVESELQPRYDYIVRDPMLGPQAEGYGEDYCFIQVTVGSRGIIGEGLEGDLRQGRGLGRNASHAMIGPIECE